jgi:hypothetical protein
MGVSAGVVAGLTVTLSVLALAHWPAPGVKVRVKVPLPAALGLKLLPPLTPGPDQVPLMPLWVVFSAVGPSAWQKGPMGVSAGVVAGLTVMLRVLVLAHWPGLGVKV